VIFVAMGSPTQEYLMESIHNRYKAVYQGLGGSFDLYVGETKRAPKSWIKRNLEWAFRLLSQPRRIKRQIHLIRFYLLLKLNKF
jgi:UDP-N-acetyl-D-mannosaminouronate:lipid I N-acetyl-D-mannosaminouronosyltransferase